MQLLKNMQVQTLTSGISAHFVDAAAGTDAADDEHNDEDHKPRYCHADSDIGTIVALGEIMKKQSHLKHKQKIKYDWLQLDFPEKCKYNKSKA